MPVTRNAGGALCAVRGALRKGQGADRPASINCKHAHWGPRSTVSPPLLRSPLSQEHQHKHTRHQITLAGREKGHGAALGGRVHCACVHRLPSRDRRKSSRELRCPASIALCFHDAFSHKIVRSRTTELREPNAPSHNPRKPVLPACLQEGSDAILLRVCYAVLDRLRPRLMALDNFEAVLTAIKVTPLQWGLQERREVRVVVCRWSCVVVCAGLP